MARRRIELSDDDFSTAVPFGFVVDADGVLTTVGDALERRLGARPGDRIDDVFQIVRPAGRTQFLDLPVDPSATVVLRARRLKLELKGSTMSLDDGALTAFFASAIVRDIDEFRDRGLQLSDFPPSDATPDLLLSMQATRTALEDARKLSTELKAALIDAQAATQAKARFLAVMSHEIRTPLNGFGSMIDLLRDSGLDADQLENLDTMDRCTRSLLILVNDILDFSKLEAGRIEIARTPTNLHAAFARMTEHFRAHAREKGLALDLEIGPPKDTWVDIDVERTRQIVANLIGNALKFTRDGRVQVRVSAPAEGRLAVDVVDTGDGIPEQDRARLFEPFVQADASSTRRHGGTGLGLTISQQLAHAMGGDVTLVRTGDDGTHFRFELEAPRAQAPARSAGARTAASPDEAERFAGVSVLVAEDDHTNQLIARKMLQKLGVRTTVVDDGAAAVEAAGRERFDLILMDVMMPQMNGIEATSRIREGDGPCQKVPIVAFSAAAFGDDRAAADKAGMSGFIEKPARLAVLREVLHRHLDGGADSRSLA